MSPEEIITREFVEGEALSDASTDKTPNWITDTRRLGEWSTYQLHAYVMHGRQIVQDRELTNGTYSRFLSRLETYAQAVFSDFERAPKLKEKLGNI